MKCLGIALLVATYLISAGECDKPKPPKPYMCGCTFEYQPVCGSDGVTYPNICVLNCRNQELIEQGCTDIIIVAHFGECDEGCFCPEVYDPVCASDGNTWGNPCKLGCENKRRVKNHQKPLDQVYKGECLGCPAVYDPVCGTDLKTYPNTCELEVENRKREQQGLPRIYVAYNGECKC